MALSQKKVPTENLVAFVEYVQRLGCKVTEFPPIDPPNPGAHNPKSWHYDMDGRYGQAADINYPAGGGAEREVFTKAVRVGQSMGIGLLYALNGTVGSAAQHTTHLHGDVGSYSNLGGGSFKQRGGDLVVWNTQPIVAATGLAQDNLDGPDTRKRLDAVMLASRRHGTKMPYGEDYLRAVLGVPPGQRWQPYHDRAVNRLEAVWAAAGLYDGKVGDNIWGPRMDRALAALHRKYGV